MRLPIALGFVSDLAGISCFLLLIAVGTVSLGFRRLRGTTLFGPLVWLLAALLVIFLVQLAKVAGWMISPSSIGAYELLAAAATVCPIMSVLGAKRPQHSAWHFVVASLWVILILPATEVLLIRAGAEIRMHGVRQGFLLTLIALGAANYCPTRLAIPACFYALGQMWMIFPAFLPGNEATAFEWGSVCFALAVILANTRIQLSKRHQAKRHQVEDWSDAWLRFRDAYGALWSIRVMERMNAASDRLDWRTRLTWSGFHAQTTQDFGESQSLETKALEPKAERSFRMLLRRFVSPTWFPAQPTD